MTTTYIIDIETCPADGPPPECPEWFLNRGIRDNFKPETVEKYQRENAEAWFAEEYKKVASLDWRLGQIVAIGLLRAVDGVAQHIDLWAVNANPTLLAVDQIEGYEGMTVAVEGTTESVALGDISIDFRSRLAGFNHRSFDLPWIAGRAMVHGIPCNLPRASRYDPSRITDWSDILCNYGGYDMKGWNLEAYLKLFGIESQGFGSGKDVGDWYANGEHDKILRHLLGDLLDTYELDKRCAPAYGLV